MLPGETKISHTIEAIAQVQWIHHGWVSAHQQEGLV
jgi:hypothetical protein